jgi:hypothetical protein
MDLRVDKLAVPKFEPVPLPANRPGGMINNRIAEEVEKYNASVERLNFELDRSFQHYPWKYELVSYNADEKEMWRQGLFIYPDESQLIRQDPSRRCSVIRTNNSETEYITLLRKPDGSFTLTNYPGQCTRTQILYPEPGKE